MVAASVLPLVRVDHWAVRVFDFPRLQITVIGLAVMAAHLLVREDAGASELLLHVLLAACLVYQLWRIWPYTPLHRKQVQRVASRDDARTLSVLISNVLMTNRESGKLRALIRRYDPDVVLTVETDAWWEQQLRELEQSHPHVLKQPQPNTYGMLLYSRLPLVDAQIRFLVERDIPSMHTRVRLRSGDEVQLKCLHPRPPAPGESTRSTERDAELLLVGKELEGQDLPSVVVGDLNDVAWSHTNGLFQKISGLLDPRIGRGLYSTFNANWPFIRFPVDHAFVSRHLEVADFEVLPHVGSDHFPVFVRVTLCAEAAAANETPEQPSADDEREAAEKISRAG
jgi:endonuclease/exonuclease/phosphatase (EEP) superfamily protein YafD